jgi:hypothetical protein
MEAAEPLAQESAHKKSKSRRGGKRARRARERRAMDVLPAAPSKPETLAAKSIPAPAAKPFVKKHPRRKPNRKKPEPVESM